MDSSTISNIYSYLDLDLVPPVPSGTFGDEFLPSVTITGNCLCSSPGDTQLHVDLP